MCSPPAVVRLGLACVAFFESAPALVWFGALAQRKAKEGGILNTRVKVHPISWLTPVKVYPPNFGGPRPRDTATVRPFRWQSFLCTFFHWESPTNDFFAHGIRKIIAVWVLGSRPS
jgi:hypothetical protein